MSGLEWDEVAARFDAATLWWIATGAPEAGPHAVPVWGVLVGGRLHWYADAASRRSRDLRIDPRAVLHLESGADVLIVRGVAGMLGTAPEHPDVTAAYRRKYTGPGDAPYLPDTPEYAEVEIWSLAPSSAVTWDMRDFEGSHRRWRHAPG